MFFGTKIKSFLLAGVFFLNCNCLLVARTSETLPVQESYLSAENFAGSIIEQEDIGKTSSITLSLPIDKPEYYGALQNKIAKLIPKEFERPTIDLILTGEKGINSSKTFGILGGMGPLSDARIVELVVTKLRKTGLLDECRIHLLSAPPPRTFSEMFWGLSSYLFGLYSFLNEEHSLVYLASNTAYIYFNFMSKMGKGNIVNLVSYVASTVGERIENPCVLILGTVAARKESLYEKLFEERNIKYVRLSTLQQEIVDQEIEKTKMHKLGDEGETLYKTIHAAIKEKEKEGIFINCILLGCTELPIALEEKKTQLADLGILILDSEQIFAEKIAIDIEESIRAAK